MSEIIIPDAQDIEGLSRRERKQFEREQKQRALEPYKQVRMKDLLEIVPMMVDPALSVFQRQIRIQYIASQAVKEVLIAKGIITNEEYTEMFETVVKKLTEETPETPNSPALEEAKEASEGREVARLTEVPRTEDEENAVRRLVD